MIEINSKNEKDKHKIFSLMQSYGYKQIYQGNWIEKYKDYDISNFFLQISGFDFGKIILNIFSRK